MLRTRPSVPSKQSQRNRQESSSCVNDPIVVLYDTSPLARCTARVYLSWSFVTTSARQVGAHDGALPPVIRALSSADFFGSRRPWVVYSEHGYYLPCPAF